MLPYQPSHLPIHSNTHGHGGGVRNALTAIDPPVCTEEMILEKVILKRIFPHFREIQRASNLTASLRILLLQFMATVSDTLGEDLGYDFVGEGSGWVEAYTECLHLHHLNADTQNLPRFDTLCKTCKDPNENWLCLSCKEVYCGRYINGHMLAHSKDASHPLAAGFRDLSVWCFECEHYLDAQVILQLRPIFESLHLMKFGEPAPSRTELKNGDPVVLELS